jgi:hypothetical protein
MAEKIWQVEKIKYCEHVGHEVRIENEVVYPAKICLTSRPELLRIAVPTLWNAICLKKQPAPCAAQTLTLTLCN